jgi:hypothetical protein
MGSARIPDAIKRVFTETFSARDVAEPLASFDAGAASENVRDFMNARGFDIVGIRTDGEVVGYVERASLEESNCGQYLQPLEKAAVLSDTVSLLAVLINLNRAEFLFVNMLGKVAGIITRDDMQKPTVRMWLFGIVTLVEMRFSDLIERYSPEDSWRKYLSEARLQKAQSLLAERRRRNQQLQLLDCLQFADKGQIIARNEDIRKWTVFASRGQAEEASKRLEQLRNNLAHAQDIVTSDWSTIVQLCEFIVQQ